METFPDVYAVITLLRLKGLGTLEILLRENKQFCRNVKITYYTGREPLLFLVLHYELDSELTLGLVFLSYSLFSLLLF